MANIITPIFRAGFARIADPDELQGKDGKPYNKYSVLMMLERNDSPEYSALIEAIDKALETTAKEQKTKRVKSPVKEADDYEYAGSYPGGVNISAWSYDEPDIIDTRKNRVKPEDVYSGCYLRAVVEPNSYSFKDDSTGMRSVGVNLRLKALMFVEDGENLGGSQKIDAESAFDGFFDAGAKSTADEFGL
jgi:hypothetical protein